MASNEGDGEKYHGYENCKMKSDEPPGHHQDLSLESRKKKEVVTGGSEVKPQIGVTNQDQGISLDRSSQEKSVSDEELESLRKKIEEDQKRYQLMIEKKEAEKKEAETHQSAELSDVRPKADDISVSAGLVEGKSHPVTAELSDVRPKADDISAGLVEGKSHPVTDSDSEANELEEIRIVLVGHTGNGKSSTGNTILGKNVFKAASNFISTTESCSIGETIRDRKKIIVVDTPGLGSTVMSTEKTLTEIRKCVGVCLPGPHAILFVLQIGKRFTTEEEKTVTQLKKVFKDTFYEFLIVLFTKKDVMGSGETLDQLLRKIPQSLQNVLEKAKNKIIGFCNDETRTTVTEYMTQVDELFAAINALGENKEIKYYTDSNLKKLEKGIKKKRKEKTNDEIRKEILQEEESYSIVKKYFCC